MHALTTAENLHKFMQRVDRVAPAGELSGAFALASAAATLEAHLDFIAELELSYTRDAQWPMATAIAGFRREAGRFRSCLLRRWLSRTLSSASTSAPDGCRRLGTYPFGKPRGNSRLARGLRWEQGRKEASEAYFRALGHGHALLSLVIPSALRWYDATIGRKR
jgi:hypothetical protein